ncbi:MAG: hypothetical protein AB8I08_21675 [Sandaracinaceae bacterium]
MRRTLVLVLSVGLAGCSLIFNGDDLRGDGSIDAGPTDAGSMDAGTDAGAIDGGPTDAGPTDGGPTDGGPTDAGPADATVDAGPCADMDMDGFRSSECGGLDCDDSVAEVKPGAAVACSDEVVSDCDLRTLGVTLSHRETWPETIEPVARMAATLDADGSLLAIGLPHATGVGWQLSLGAPDRASLTFDTVPSGCFDTGVMADFMALAPGQRGHVRAALATSAMDQPVMQGFDVTDLAGTTTWVAGDCVRASGYDVTVNDVFALRTSDVSLGEGTVAAAVGNAVTTLASPPTYACIAAGQQQCAMGATGPGTVEHGGALRGMVLGESDGTVYWREAEPTSAGPPLPLFEADASGRIAAAQSGRTAVVAVPSAGELTVAMFTCVSSDCLEPDVGSLVRTPAAGILPEIGDPLLSLAAIGSRNFLLAFRTMAGVSLLVVTPVEGGVSIGTAVMLADLRFDGPVIDLALLSPSNAPDEVWVVVTTGGGSPMLHRVHFDVCTTP